MSYVGVPPFGQTVRTITEVTATAGQTAFTPSGGYLPGYVDVSLNGIALSSADFTATNGTTVTLAAAAAVGDEFRCVAYWPVSLADTYRKSEVDAGFVAKTSATGAALLPVGTTAQRPASPTAGMIRQNSTTGNPEWYDTATSAWVPFGQIAGSLYQVEYLVVAGGGGGAGGQANGNGTGGGGAGGFRTASIILTSGTAYTATVGAGGAAGQNNQVGAKGADSVFGSVTSAGGGGGATYLTATNANGGSGGGGGGGGPGPGSGTSGQGNAGGVGFGSNVPFRGGGGGGANSVGSTGASTGNGGAGSASSISGATVTYAGGGGGGGFTGYPSSGGAGGGGGGAGGAANGTSGSANTGGGGGGGGWDTPSWGAGGAGGSGIVIIRYAGAQRGTGGTVTSSGGYTIHTFTSSGTYTA
jgi:hypothetical protein